VTIINTRKWIKRILPILIIAATAVIIYHYYGKKILTSTDATKKKPAPAQQRMLPIVAAAKATQQEWQKQLTAVGTTKSLQGVDIKPQVSGVIDHIYFQSGHQVKFRQILLSIDASVLKATRQNHTATLRRAKKKYQRIKITFQRHAASQSELDDSLLAQQQAQAVLKQIDAEISQHLIKAPFDGRLGIRKINLGQFISTDDAIVSLQQIKTILVDFFLPEKYLQLIKIGAQITLTTDAFPKREFHGKINALSASIDPETHNFTVRATIPNSDLILSPGLFAKVSMKIGLPQKVIVVPQTAISYTPTGESIYVINSQHIVKQQYVEVGERRGNLAVIKKGINLGDMVIIAGQNKIYNGSKVSVQ